MSMGGLAINTIPSIQSATLINNVKENFSTYK